MAKDNNYIYLGALALLIASLLPWLNTYITQAINVDIAFLTLSAERLLAGERMSEAFYDTNPPLSIMLQIPAVLLAKLFSLPLYHAVSVYIFILLALSTTATYYLLKKIPDLTPEQKLIMIGAYLLINTIGTGYDFGQKDHILGMALLPLILIQILITKRIDINVVLKLNILIIGALLILLKPHYGLIPAAIFLHRAISQKRLSVIFDQDFLCLVAMTITYILGIYLVFPDFISIILPDILRFYAADISGDIVSMGIMVSILPVTCSIITLFIFKDLPKIIPALFLLSTLCLIPFILQGKGWIYHLLPSAILFTVSFSVLLDRIIRILLNEFKIKNNLQTITSTITFLSIISLAVYSGLTKSNKPTHAQYQNLEFTKIINSCEQPCSFLVLHDMINIAQELSIYTKKLHASRFPVLWFVPTLLNAQRMLDEGEKLLYTQNEINQATAKYTNMVAQDFEKYNPDIIFVAHLPHPSKEGKVFNFRDYLLETNKSFKNIWNNYTLERTISIDRIEYLGQKKPNEKIMRYDVYKKIKHSN